MKISITALDHVQVAIPVNGEESARAYYSGVLGMTEVEKPEELRDRGGCWFESGDARIHAGVEAQFVPARKAHPAFLVEDLRQTRDTLRANGIKCTEQEHMLNFNRFYSEDPFGNRIEFMMCVD